MLLYARPVFDRSFFSGGSVSDDHGHSHSHDEPRWFNRLMMVLAVLMIVLCIGAFIYAKQHGFP